LISTVIRPGDQAVAAELERAEHRERVHDQRDAVLVVGDAEPVGAVAVDAEGLLREHPLQVDRIHVREQEDAGSAGPAEARDHGAADLLRGVAHAVNVARRDDLDITAERPQAAGDDPGNSREPLDVAAARLDGHQFAQGVEERRPLGAHQIPQCGRTLRGRGRLGPGHPAGQHGREQQGAGRGGQPDHPAGL
jgi:hypothetical protein